MYELVIFEQESAFEFRWCFENTLTISEMMWFVDQKFPHQQKFKNTSLRGDVKLQNYCGGLSPRVFLVFQEVLVYDDDLKYFKGNDWK